MADDEVDDWESMTFADEPVKETSLQRNARLKKEAAERGRPKSKAELAEEAKLKREEALATAIDDSNKGAKMMAKMGFKGGPLGKSEDARTKPIELLVKSDRGGIGMDGEKKRKVREAADATEEGRKRQKVELENYRERSRIEREERRNEGLWKGAMKVLETLEEDESKPTGEDESNERPVKKDRSSSKLKDVNVLYRPLLKQHLEKERSRQMRYELNNSLSTRNEDLDSEDDNDAPFDKRIDQLDDEDVALDEYGALSLAERIQRVTDELREKHWYCFWCKFQYPDAEMDGCPGATEDEHG